MLRGHVGQFLRGCGICRSFRKLELTSSGNILSDRRDSAQKPRSASHQERGKKKSERVSFKIDGQDVVDDYVRREQ